MALVVLVMEVVQVCIGGDHGAGGCSGSGGGAGAQ